MIFRREALREVLAGRSTITIRRAVGHPPEKRDPWTIGESYAAQVMRSKKDEFTGKSKKVGETVTRITVRSTDRGHLHEIDDDVAQAAAFPSAFDLFEWWFETYGEGWGHRIPGNQPVLVPIFVVRFEVGGLAPPQLLAPTSGYTSDPHHALGARQTAAGTDLSEVEPAAVDKPTLELYATENRARFQELRGDEAHKQEARSWGRRARELRLRAAREGVDGAAEIRGINNNLAALERKVQEAERRRRAA